MTDTTTRKAVVTTAQVTEAFASYVAALTRIGQNISDHEFDKGFRGRGFAEYDGKGNVVRSFDTKEDALTTYGLTAKGMWLVLDTLPTPEEEKVTKPAKGADKPAA
jgi:hypothetical protein